MGMLLRRHDRKADRTPTVNGKPVRQEPKKKNLAEKQTTEGRVRPPQYR
jgi:hypothetical protein